MQGVGFGEKRHGKGAWGVESDGSFCFDFSFLLLQVKLGFGCMTWRSGSFFLRLEKIFRDCGVSMSNCEILVCMMV
jgi:hypothetical protein